VLLTSHLQPSQSPPASSRRASGRKKRDNDDDDDGDSDGDSDDNADDAVAATQKRLTAAQADYGGMQSARSVLSLSSSLSMLSSSSSSSSALPSARSIPTSDGHPQRSHHDDDDDAADFSSSSSFDIGNRIAPNKSVAPQQPSVLLNSVSSYALPAASPTAASSSLTAAYAPKLLLSPLPPLSFALISSFSSASSSSSVLDTQHQQQPQPQQPQQQQQPPSQSPPHLPSHSQPQPLPPSLPAHQPLLSSLGATGSSLTFHQLLGERTALQHTLAQQAAAIENERAAINAHLQREQVWGLCPIVRPEMDGLS
jgi:hypothetical protein